MTDSRSELMALAARVASVSWKASYTGIVLLGHERDLIVSALRLAASQPDREMVARATTQAALTALRAGGDNLAIFNAVNESLTLLLVGGDQKTTQITKPTSSRTEATATETVLIPGDAGGAV